MLSEIHIKDKADEPSSDVTDCFLSVDKKSVTIPKNPHLFPRQKVSSFDIKNTLRKAKILSMESTEKWEVAPKNYAWFCDKCNKAQFQLYRECVDHEQLCNGMYKERYDNKEHYHESSPTKNSPKSIHLPPLFPAPQNFSWFCDYCNLANFRTYKEAIHHEEHCKEQYVPVWVCDRCCKAKFKTYVEAENHEKGCIA